MLFDKKFDLIISLGEDCACSSYLRRFNLQYNSYPFDWLTGAEFSKRIDLLCNNFERFLNIEDLKNITKKNTNLCDNRTDSYQNNYTNFNFYHDFLKEIPFETMFNKVKEKYERRINRMYTHIETGENILFVWWSRDKHLENDNLINAYEKLSKKFKNKSIYLLIIEYKNTDEPEYLQINNNVLKVSYDNISFESNPQWNKVLGNEKNNNKIFSQIKRKYTFKQKLNLILIKFILLCVNLIPIKTKRKHLRKEIHRLFSHAKL